MDTRLDEKRALVEKDEQSLALPDEEAGQDYTVPIVLFFGGSVPLVALTQALGWGMPGFIIGAVGAGLVAATGSMWSRRLLRMVPGLEQYRNMSWSTFLKALDADPIIVNADPALEYEWNERPR